MIVRPSLDRIDAGLADRLARIGPLDALAMTETAGRLDQLTKPRGSLGRLEELAILIAGITGRTDAMADRRAIVIAAGDHGVARRGVSAYPSEVTAQMVANFVAGGAAINVLAEAVGAQVTVVDVGVATPIQEPRAGRGRPHPADRGGRLVRARIRSGTSDITEGPAMSRDEAHHAIEVGCTLADGLVADGVELIGIGEMGIGNTTVASALTVAFTGRPVEAVTGRGTGIDDETHTRKIAAIKRASSVNVDRDADPVDRLAALGGFEIAALVGVVVAAAAARIPIVLDGFITGAAALVATALQPAMAPRLIASHRSAEPGHGVILEALGLRPLLELDLRLGEGTGAALAMPLIGAAIAMRDGMATFESAGVAGPGESTPGHRSR